MPNRDWTCSSCQSENPPYTEVCRDCYKPALPENHVQRCSNLDEIYPESHLSWKSFWTYEQPKTNEVAVVPSTDKAIASYVGFVGAYFYLKYGDIAPSSPADFMYVARWFFIWALTGFGMAFILQLCVAKRRADRKFYIDKNRVRLSFLIRRLLDVGLFFSGGLVMLYFWKCVIS